MRPKKRFLGQSTLIKQTDERDRCDFNSSPLTFMTDTDGTKSSTSPDEEAEEHIEVKPSLIYTRNSGDDEKLDAALKLNLLRKRHKQVKAFIGETKYDLVKSVFRNLGIRIVKESDPWTICWTDTGVSYHRLATMKSFQRINHFPGMSEIYRKDYLATNLNNMKKIFPEDYSFYPQTWVLPRDFRDLYARFRRFKSTFYIIKPENKSQGRGIFLTKNISKIGRWDTCVCQRYITNPFLVDGYKFDFRLYVMVTSVFPLSLYIYNEGLVRVATELYTKPSCSNMNNPFMHLTNYSVNKSNSNYNESKKRKLEDIKVWLHEHGVDVKQLWDDIDDVIVKTMIAAISPLQRIYSIYLSDKTRISKNICFEILGFDIIITQNLKPYVLEVNHSPSFKTDSQVDIDVKENMLQDVLLLLNLNRHTPFKVKRIERREAQMRLFGSSLEKPLKKVYTRTKTKQDPPKYCEFRKIYPRENENHKYDKFFKI